MTYPTPAPANYDGGQKIDVDPVTIEAQAKSLGTLIDSINDKMTAIWDAWDSLKLSWVGTTQQEADAFNTQWKKAVVEMFGDPDAPDDEIPGQGQAALGKIKALVIGASKTYAYAEDQLARNLLAFGDGVGGNDVPSDVSTAPLPDHVMPAKPPADGGGSGGDPNGGARDYQDAPITESNAAK